MTEISKKLEDLKAIVKDLEGVVIAYSGGVDSTLLAKVCYDVLSKDAVAVTATSKTYPSHELEAAKRMAEKIGVRHIVIETDELSNKEFVRNPPDRCYFCKTELFTRLRDIAGSLNFKNVIDGSNVDDDGDFRPGLRAAGEMGVRSPLKEAGLTKADVREISQLLGLETWDKPALACMSSRIPYGQDITTNKLSMVSEAEDFLRNMGFKHLRVRHHDTIARIEVPLDEIPSLVNNDIRTAVIGKFKEIGFNYITLDIEGLRSGSMNEVLKDKDKYIQPQGKPPEVESNHQSSSSSTTTTTTNLSACGHAQADPPHRHPTQHHTPHNPQPASRNPHLAPRTPPPTPHLTIYTDGASRGNPGRAGIGIAIYGSSSEAEADQRLLEEISEYIGETTSNVAEYNALRRAVKRAVELNPREVIFRLDSELLVRQINKEYRVKAPKLIPLYKEVRELLKRLTDWKVVHIPRRWNNHADALANKGIDSAIDDRKTSLSHAHQGLFP